MFGEAERARRFIFVKIPNYAAPGAFMLIPAENYRLGTFFEIIAAVHNFP